MRVMTVTGHESGDYLHPDQQIEVIDEATGRKCSRYLRSNATAAYRRELRRFLHPRSVGGIEVQAKKRGMDVGFRAAEASVVLREEWA